MSDRRTPFANDGERETLTAFLDYLRESVALKVLGLSHDAQTRALVPSGTSLLGLVKHLTMVEVAWFQWAFAGLEVAVPTGELEAHDTEASALAAYRSAIERSAQIVACEPDLGKLCARKLSAPQPMSLRWVLVHMVEETGRHAGHADILREQLDGETGR